MAQAFPQSWQPPPPHLLLVGFVGQLLCPLCLGAFLWFTPLLFYLIIYSPLLRVRVFLLFVAFACVCSFLLTLPFPEGSISLLNLLFALPLASWTFVVLLLEAAAPAGLHAALASSLALLCRASGLLPTESPATTRCARAAKKPGIHVGFSPTPPWGVKGSDLADHHGSARGAQRCDLTDRSRAVHRQSATVSLLSPHGPSWPKHSHNLGR